jgi:hypothetical protein
MAEIDPELVERFTGQRRITTVEAARAELGPLKSALHDAAHNDQTADARRRGAHFEYKVCHCRLWLAQVPSRFGRERWAIVLVIGSVVGFCAGLCFIFIVRASLLGTVSVAVFPTLYAVAPLIFPSAIEPIANLAQRYEKAYELALNDHNATSDALNDAQERYVVAKRLHDGILRAREHPLSRLLNVDIRSMSGPEFELFLADVFRFLGYSVRPTGKSGDKGVDLIVARGARDVALQAKCYSGTVGNWAVQEAFTGMAIYRCQRCAVITSSTFTAAARTAAAATGCILIDGSQIHDLIRGRIVV